MRSNWVVLAVGKAGQTQSSCHFMLFKFYYCKPLRNKYTSMKIQSRLNVKIHIHLRIIVFHIFKISGVDTNWKSNQYVLYVDYHPKWKSRRLAAAILSSILSELASAHSQSTTKPICPPCFSWKKKYIQQKQES